MFAVGEATTHATAARELLLWKISSASQIWGFPNFRNEIQTLGREHQERRIIKVLNERTSKSTQEAE